MKLRAFQALVRPGVTWALVASQTAMAMLWATGAMPHSEQAFAALSPFTMNALTYYFKARDTAERNGGG